MIRIKSITFNPISAQDSDDRMDQLVRLLLRAGPAADSPSLKQNGPEPERKKIV